MADEKVTKKILVDQDLCIGCGGCVGIAPDYFDLNDEGKSVVKKAYEEADNTKIEEAISGCPVQAITLEDE